MGLDYLQKKNWHPGSMRNREEVWLREQLQKEIMKKELERAKKLQEEKHNEELKRLQVEAGLIPKSHLERMEWMYEWGNKLHQQQKSAEEYLLGKPVTMDEAEKLQKDKQKGNQPPIFKEEVTNAKCEDFSKIHEDPLFFILSGEQKMVSDLQANPLRLKQAAPITIDKKIEKQNKSERKKKDKKKKKRSSSTSSSSSEKKSKTSKNSSISQSQQLYQSYLQKNLGHLLVQDEQGNFVPDFGLMKRRAKPDYREKNVDSQFLRQQMKLNAEEIIAGKQSSYDKMKQSEQQQSQNKGKHFLVEARKQVYNIERQDGLEDRLKRNRNNLSKELQQEDQ